MKKLLVTGASGFLGWNVCRIAQKEWKVYGTVFSHPVEIPGANVFRTDLTNYKELKKVFSEVCPDAVIHTAAESSPNYCQEYPEVSRKINVDASVNIAGLCADLRIPYVFTSTDLVFDGMNPPYCEEDQACPVNIYAEQKILAEEETLRIYPSAVVCRMALMFGIPGPANLSFIQPMIEAFREGRELRLFVNEFRTPLSVGSAIQGLLLALGKGKGLLHLGGMERISRYNFGLLMMDVFGFSEAKLLRCRYEDIPMPAPRSPDVSLDSSKAMAMGFKPMPLREELGRLAESA
jgi:dTDP-4-dehydrorhamnose reductase